MATKSLRRPLRPRTPETTVPEPRPMSRADICNVEPLSPDQERNALAAKVIADLLGGSAGERWTLSEGGAS